MKGISSSVIRCFIKIKTHLNQRVCHLPRQGKANLSDSSLDRGEVLLNRFLRTVEDAGPYKFREFTQFMAGQHQQKH